MMATAGSRSAWGNPWLNSPAERDPTMTPVRPKPVTPSLSALEVDRDGAPSDP